MARGSTSAAVKHQLAMLQRAGYPEVTEFTLERWRTAGATPTPTLESRGGGGFRAVYPWYADRQVLAAARVHRRLGRVRATVLVLYAEGWVIPTDELRRAALDELDDRERRYREAAAGDPVAAASRAAFTEKRNPRGQRWRSRYEGGARNPDSYDALVSALAGGFSILTGDPGDVQDRERFLTLSGLAATVHTLSPKPDSTAPDLSEVEDIIHLVQMPAIRHGLSIASTDDFDDAQRISATLADRMRDTPLAAELLNSDLDYALNVLGIAALLTTEQLGPFLRSQRSCRSPSIGALAQ
jgi:hypothetical protein